VCAREKREGQEREGRRERGKDLAARGPLNISGLIQLATCNTTKLFSYQSANYITGAKRGSHIVEVSQE
jgi:hypothetical protein